MKNLLSITFILILSLITSAGAQTTFTNSATITINDGAAAAPYPSNITVSGVNGTVTDIKVRLNGLSHTYLSDVALLLVSPDTDRRFLLLSDCGNEVVVSNITVTFDDQASGLVPCDATNITNGSYRPTSRLFDNGTTLDPLDPFPAPAPQPPSSYSQPAPTGTATLNEVFGGFNPNGVWSLYVVDSFNADSGSIANGYSLIITTTLPFGIEADVSPRGNGNGMVSSTDVSVIQGFQLGFGLPYQSNEFQRADCAPFNTRGDGRISSIDVSQAQAYQNGFNLTSKGSPQQAAGPTSPIGELASEYDPLQSFNKANQIRFGDSTVQAPREAHVAETSPGAAQTVVVPINVVAFGDESVYGFSLSYDRTKLSNPVVTIGNAGASVASNTTQAGRIGVSVSFGGGTIAPGNGQRLINVQFTIAANAVAGTTPITFTDQPTFREVASSPSNVGGVQALPINFAGGIITINQSAGKSRKRIRTL